eukprot:3866185-Prymnesium_polylepis.1
MAVLSPHRSWSTSPLTSSKSKRTAGVDFAAASFRRPPPGFVPLWFNPIPALVAADSEPNRTRPVSG